jgi:geranylgeranyl transferase type-1 subunit beta
MKIENSETDKMQTQLCIQYFKSHLKLLPHHYTSTDCNRMSLLYFCLSGLDLLNVLFTLDERNQFIRWIYAQQVYNSKLQTAGFRGGSFAGAPFPLDNHATETLHEYDVPHIAMTYTALACLLILEDDFKFVQKQAIINELRLLQTDQGSFRPYQSTTENDMRFLFCACCISYMLNDWSGVDKKRALEYIKKSKCFDGGYAQGPFQESHGGSTYCAIASLALMDELNANEHRDTVFWLLKRQISGFQGRINKPADTCYSFWIGASLEILKASQFINFEEQARFLETTESRYGGFGKECDSYPDLLHSYMGLSGLSIAKDPALKSLDCTLGITTEKWTKFLEKTNTKSGLA